MKDFLLDGLAVAYACAGLICCVAYYPTMVDLYYRRKPSANTTTYLLWTTTAMITLLYSTFILTDVLFRIISVVNLIACSLILFLCFRITAEQRSGQKQHFDDDEGGGP